jgi:hypothetical protein
VSAALFDANRASDAGGCHTQSTERVFQRLCSWGPLPIHHAFRSVYWAQASRALNCGDAIPFYSIYSHRALLLYSRLGPTSPALVAFGSAIPL